MDLDWCEAPVIVGSPRFVGAVGRLGDGPDANVFPKYSRPPFPVVRVVQGISEGDFWIEGIYDFQHRVLHRDKVDEVLTY